jgi:hypothetical protein
MSHATMASALDSPRLSNLMLRMLLRDGGADVLVLK